MTREEFMEAYRNDNELIESLSAEDCNEIFTTVLKGSTDITAGLIAELCNEYEYNSIAVFTKMSAYDLIDNLVSIEEPETNQDGNQVTIKRYIRKTCILMDRNEGTVFDILAGLFRDYITKSNMFNGYIIDNVDIEYYSDKSISLRQVDSGIEIRFKDITTFRNMFQYNFTVIIK